MSEREDYYYRLAKERGFRSRAYYKLEQIDEKFSVFSDGDWVLDIGAYPGGWSQYAAGRVGRDGLVISVDVRPIPVFERSNIQPIEADIDDEGVIDEIRERADRPLDVLLSDISPNVTGAWEVDVAKQVALTMRALEVGDETLRRGGKAVMKVFEGKDTWRAEEELDERFASWNRFKPESSRKSSAEYYLVAYGYQSSP